MISVLNRRLLSNGSRLCLIALIFFTSCSPKVVPVKDNKPAAPEPAEVKPVENRKFSTANMALLLPFQLKPNDKLFDKADVEKAEMAIDFYQGFKLGVDSAALSGQNFKIAVVDSKGATQSIAAMLKQDELQNANLVVGPVFPESIKQLGKTGGQYFISPLAATMPDEFNNPQLISLIPNIRLHAEKMVNYITKKYKTENTIVVLINPKNAESEVLGAQLRLLLTVSAVKINFQEYPTVAALETKFQKDKQYVVLISSPDKDFVVQSIDKLAKIKKRLGYPIDLFGHPNWAKQNYNTEQLQALNTCITSSYRVNYKRTAVINFVKKYRETFNFEPDEYAFKGFDTGFYFGRLLAKYGKDYMLYLTKEKFTGLQNNYAFYKDDKLGYINTGLTLLKYKNFVWGVVE